VKALQLERHGGGPVLASPPDPVPTAGEVVVGVEYCAVAVGELLVSSGARQEYHGTADSFTYPHTPGFQGVGRIVSAGPGVSAERVGERVTINGVLGCGECAECRRAAENRCERHALLGLDSRHAGCMAEYVSVPERNAHTWPDQLSPTLAPFVSELATMVHAVRRIDCGPGDDLAVVGAGQTGLFGVASGRIAGVSQVISVDIDPERLELARGFGADHTVDARSADPVDAVHELTGEGVSRVIEVVGSTETVGQAIRMLAPRGVAALVGTGTGIVFDLPDYERIVTREISLRGCLGKTNREYAIALSWIADGKVDLGLLPLEVYPLERFEDAWQAAEEPGSPRIVIEIGQAA
jgi:threonine dehydrogenase-like Zn-dependent dehydrogenase